MEENNQEKEMIDSSIVMQILGISQQIEDLDAYFEELPNLQFKTDEEISDLLHYIENNDLTPRQSTKMIKLLQQKRLIRRGLSNDNAIKNTYNTYKNKLIVNSQRQFFLTEIYKKAKELNSTYKNRQLTDEDIKNLIK